MYWWEAAKRSQVTITELLLFCKSTGVIFAMPFLPHKGFALTGRLKTSKCGCLWKSWTDGSSSYLLLKIKQLCSSQNRQLFTVFHLTLIFYPHHTDMRSQMLYTNGVIWNLPTTNVGEAASNTRLKHLLAAEKNIYAHAKIINSLHDRF